MDTLLIRLAAPLQSWGVQSRYDDRDSALEPSKSGVIGLLCAALGRPRQANLSDLAALRMGVRVDREGILKSDYQTIKDPKKPVVSHRHFLSGAVFLVGLEGDLAVLTTLQTALQHPHWALFLGRKSFPPAEPVWLPHGLRRGEDLLTALGSYPRLVPAPKDSAELRLRLVLDDPLDGEQLVADVPLSFANRRFVTRRVHTSFIELPLTPGG